MQAGQVRGLGLREIGGGFTKHHCAPYIRSACYATINYVAEEAKYNEAKRASRTVICGTWLIKHTSHQQFTS